MNPHRLGKRISTALLCASLAAIGCGGGSGDGGGTDTPNPPPPPSGGSCSGGDTLLYVVSSLGAGVPTTDGRVPGFDVDQRTSDASDGETCNQPDYVSPPPESRAGVDNQLGPIVASFDFQDEVETLFDAAIEDGSLLLLVEISHVQSVTDDDCVTVAFLNGFFPPGIGDPIIGADGQLAPGQLIDIDQSFLDASGNPLYQVANARIAGGVVDTGHTSITPTYTVGGTAAPITFNQLAVRLDGDHARAGVIGGSFEIETVAAIIGPQLGSLEPFVLPALRSKADLARDAGGTCQSLSAGLVFSAVSAVAGEVR